MRSALDSQQNRLASCAQYVQIAGEGKTMHVGLTCFAREGENSHSAFQMCRKL